MKEINYKDLKRNKSKDIWSNKTEIVKVESDIIWIATYRKSAHNDCISRPIWRDDYYNEPYLHGGQKRVFKELKMCGFNLDDFIKYGIQDGYRIYSNGDENWYATRLNYEDTLTAISNFEDLPKDEIYLEECDIDKEGMWYPVDENKVDTTDASKYQIFEGQLEEYVSFREALKRMRNESKEWYNYGKDVFMISTSNR